MDHYTPKRRVPVSLWSQEMDGVEGHVFLDLDPAGNRHQTVLEKLNESSRFLPVAIGDEGRIQLFNKQRLTRVSTACTVLQSDVFSRGFLPWREEEVEVALADGCTLQGRLWMPLQRQTQRVSDFMNQQGWQFFVLLAAGAVHLLNAGTVTGMKLAESAGAPLAATGTEGDGARL